MSSEQRVTLNKLLADFPEPTGSPRLPDQQLRLLEWLHEVFTLWNDGENDEVTARRNEIASKVGRAYLLVPNPGLTLLPPTDEPRNAAFVQWLISLAINTLKTYDGNVRALNIWLFTSKSKVCLEE